MKFNDLTLTSKRSGKRVGRGISAGQGKTAGRGTKGQNSRTGSSKKPGFEGGQNPLVQRLPKLRGFTSKRVPAETVYIGQLNDLKSTGAIDNTKLAEAGLISNPYVRVKVLLGGELTKKLDVRLQSASASAIKAIEKAGGTFKAVPRVGRVAVKPKTTSE